MENYSSNYPIKDKNSQEQILPKYKTLKMLDVHTGGKHEYKGWAYFWKKEKISNFEVYN